MNFFAPFFILFLAFCICNAAYDDLGQPQLDVQAPAYVPPYAKNPRFGYGGTKTGYGGTKTAYSGRKTGYAGTKTGYAGTKTGHTNMNIGYGEKKTWYSESGSVPSLSEFHGNAIESYKAKCTVECMNNGICVNENTCECPPNFEGKYCEFEKKLCLSSPPMPKNSRRQCFAEMCTIQCMEGFKFFDGATAANVRCAGGKWVPTRADLTTLSHCRPQCDPPCLNGGECLDVNVCQCPADYRGPQCQYSASVCDVRKLAFNGGYACSGDGERFACRLHCPPGSAFSAPAAALYTCLFSTGVFEPQPIPHCVFDEVIVVTPSNYNYKPPTYSMHANTTKTQSGHNMVTVVQNITPTGGRCLTWAGMHYKTFDGKIYSFQSPCKHILVRDAEEHRYTVAVRQPECKRRDYCPSEIYVYLEDKMYALSVAEDGSVVFRSSKRLIPIPAALPGIRVSMPGDHVLVNLDALGVTLKWDTNNVISVEGSVLLWNKTEGLCGTLDGNPANELRIKDGSVALTKSVMIASWQLNNIGDICDSSPSESSACVSAGAEDAARAMAFCNKLFTKEKFRKCSQVMDVSQLLEACQWDYCACAASENPEDCACSTGAVYARECLRRGVTELQSWRDADTCPMKCPDGKVYQACGAATQPSCEAPQQRAGGGACVEGCFCPPPLLLDSGRCVQRAECPCRARNKLFPPGAVFPKGCNTCTCQSGGWSCTRAPCGARCSAVGDPHYTTFDGLRYDFMGHCTYTMLQAENVTVEVENIACSGSITEAMNLTPYHGPGKPACTKAVNLIYDGANIHLKQGGFILVNGKEVATLPVNVGDVRIRAASSLFVIIQLPIKVDLWWDGNTRVYIDIPPSMHEKTKGLCGTFNLNQKDDFLTPEGDVEQTALAFANKWKTRELCADSAAAEPEHPCRAHMERAEAAEGYCRALKSELFEPCHWHVDVQPFYEACVYDMCACDGAAARCLCPMLGDYAAACALAGVRVQWRYRVKECEVPCSGGQEYTVCADSCLRTCADVALSATGDCRPRCVEGCACPAGQVLDANNVCVLVGLCPCFHKGMEFRPGYKEVRAGRREREICTCVGARWDCVPATPDDIQNYPPAEDLRSNCSAAANKEFTTCLVAEPLTCKNMHLPPSPTTQACRPGCRCARGFVLDAGSGRCVPPAACPCHHGGRSYADRHVMQEECNTCECRSGNWSCTAKQCVGVCGAWGDSHVTTFDGADYDFEGVCQYLLAKGAADDRDGFGVEIQNEPCGTTGATCSKSVTLRVGSGADEETVSLTKSAPPPDLSNYKRVQLRLGGAYVFLDVPSLGVSLQWDRGMRVYVRVDPMWKGRVKGLCGNYNSDNRDDFQSPTSGGLPETSALIFADSWKLKPTCPKPQAVTDHCKQRPERKDWSSAVCGALKRHPFALCHAEVPPGAWLARCEADACACDAGADCECACTALAAYAHACAARGVTFKWRTQETCPMQCDGECSNYSECVPACPPETCDNTLDYAEIKTVCEKETCVEGCKPNKTCPEGSVYSNSTLTECVPRAKCKPLCMTLPDGRQLLEGEVIEQDACHTCRCSKKSRVCTGQPCSTVPPPTTPSGPPETTPHDQPQCVAGWTPWLNRAAPERLAGRSEEREPLPSSNELANDSPVCAKDLMSSIECRTVGDHRSPKETGLNAECSLENGLVCLEKNNTCPDFEIRVYCKCEEEPFQCLNSTHPNHAHPTDCAKFYECTPGTGNTHAVLKSCALGLMYNPTAMVCDWPAAVLAIRPECGTTTIGTSTKEPSYSTSTMPTSPTTRITLTNATTQSIRTTQTIPITTTVPTTHTEPATTTAIPSSPSPSTSTFSPIPPSLCPPGEVFSPCAYPCDQLCDHFGKMLRNNGICDKGQKCVSGCVAEAVAKIKCGEGAMWRDNTTCVPLKDCTCYHPLGYTIKPGGVTTNGCETCQCIENQMYCDTSECMSYTVISSSHLPVIMETSPEPTTTVRIITTYPPTTRAVYTTTSAPINETTDGYTTHYSSPHSTRTPRLETEYTVLPTTEAPTTGTPTAGAPTTEAPTTKAPTTGAPTTRMLTTGASTTGAPTTAAPTTMPTTILITSTVSPPPECAPENYINLLWERDELLPDSAFTASSVASELFEPKDAVLNGHPLDLTAGSWNPATLDQNQYIQVELPRREPLYGIYLQGSPLFDQYVTSYDVMYGDDGTVFSHVKGPDGKPKIFRGPTDNNTPAKQMFEPPIEAKFVRVRPLTWHEEIAVRFELIGCKLPATTTPSAPVTTPEPMQCTEPLGLAAELPLDSVEVSSNSDARGFLRLEGERGWRPLYSTPGEWIMFNFTSPRNLTGIKTKGGPKGWVSAYNVLYTSDLATFNPVVEAGQRKLFPGNFDKDTEVLNEFRPPIHAQYLKVLPIKWHENVEMRIEPIGCFEPYPPPPPPATTPAPVAECPLCPGVLPALADGCRCGARELYDGENCVPRDQCPCVVGIITYPVGASFRGGGCDECLCKLGGVTDCRPATQCACAPDLVPKLSPSTCECTCEPCPSETRICPTSKLCLPLDKWCDGLQDCPDDEVACTTRPPVTETVVTTVAPTVGVTRPTTTVLTTVPPTEATTAAPKTCPKVECPPGYTVRVVTGPPGHAHVGGAELPPPRPRYSYQRYYRGSKGGYSKGGFSKGGYSKGGFSKGGFYGPQAPPQQNQAFSLERPAQNTSAPVAAEECTQFKCIPKLPPPYKPGATPPPLVCSAPACPPQYTLKLDAVPVEANKCPQYSCVPPPERPVYCNVTGRTFNTFDGAEYKMDVCFHMLARENRLNSWSVMVRKKCRIEGCRNELLVHQGDELILVKPNFMIEYDNFEYTVEQTSKICFQKNSFDVGRLGNGLYIRSRKYNFTVLYNRDGDVKIGVFKQYMGQVDGLCGTFDGDWRNDRLMPSGAPARTIDEFGRSWLKPGLPPAACRTKVIDPDKQKRVWDLCDAIVKEPLSECARALNLHKWRSICLEKVCECTELVVNGSRLTEKQCRCLLLEQLVAECLAADKDVNIDSWRTLMDCPAECPPPLVHYDCYRKSCEPTCAGAGAGAAAGAAACPVTDGQCSPGCYCPEGKLRKGDQCVLPADCLDCTCTGVGAPAKYVTFEGDDLPFLGNCTYLASRDRNDTGHHWYQVYATNGACEENNASICTTAVHLVHEGNVVTIAKDTANKKLLTTVNGSPVYRSPTKNEWATISLDKGQDVIVTLPELHVELWVQQSHLQFTIRAPSALYAGRTEGLCGVCAGYRERLLTSNGTETDDFELYGKSWQATPDTLKTLGVPPQEQCGDIPPPPPCVPPPPESNPCYNLNDVDKFGACHALLDPRPLVAQCEQELCELRRADACPALARYAAACRRLGVCLAWRSALCPYPCEAPLVYRPCVGCEQTCEDHAELSAHAEKCDKPQVEGCFCPEGKVRVNNTCIEPSKCFPCDAEGKHYAGDEWQVDACTRCTCARAADERAARVSCVTETCAAPACAAHEDLLTSPAPPTACCPSHVCVPKPQNKTECKEPKKMECGFGQVLKLKTTDDGCKEFACECKPASECEHIPTDSEVDIMEPGVSRALDTSGCCPRALLLCRPDTCPRAPACAPHHVPRTFNVTGKCCPQHACDLPKDKCLVNLEWEAAPQGGERARPTPEVVLKEVDATWPDGPCRWCRCAAGAGAAGAGAAPAAECRVTECPALTSDRFVVEPRPVPFACCPAPAYVACVHGGKAYKVGENWTSPDNVCESYRCAQLPDGTLETLTTVERCREDCQLGWQYSAAAAGSGRCCGECAPVACVAGGRERRAGAAWSSPDHCTSYTCVEVDGTLQVQSSNETCAPIDAALERQFVLSEERLPGQCCPKREPVACRDGNDIYQEGQSWRSSDPCRNYTCARDAAGRLAVEASSRACDVTCARGQRYAPPPRGHCCGRCEQVACVVDGELIEPGAVWKSADNCTTYTCTNASGELYAAAARDVCPDVSACAPEDLVNGTCCQTCRQRPEAQATCAPAEVPAVETERAVRVRLGAHGLCVNSAPVAGLRECRGACAADTEYNARTGAMEAPCECCKASRYEGRVVLLQCEDGTAQPHSVASAVACTCSRCLGDSPSWGTKAWTNGPFSHGWSPFKYRPSPTPNEYIPNFDRRFGSTPMR